MLSIFDKELFDRKLRIIAHGYKKRFGDLLEYDVEKEIVKFDTWRAELAPFVVDQVRSCPETWYSCISDEQFRFH